MKKGPTSLLRKVFGMRHDMSISFYLTDFLFRRIFRQNADVSWAVHHTTTIRSGARIVRGKGVWPGDSPGMYINANNGIHVGDYANLGPNAGIISSNHDPINLAINIPGDPIRIGRFCWVGMGCIILPEVVLGDFTVVAAGAIVTKSFPEGYCIIAGNPARVIKQLNKTECDTFAASKE